jgi:hypothetical protein
MVTSISFHLIDRANFKKNKANSVVSIAALYVPGFFSFCYLHIANLKATDSSRLLNAKDKEYSSQTDKN